MFLFAFNFLSFYLFLFLYSFSESYQSKEKKNRLQEEVNNVEELDDWRPATPLDVQTAKLGEVFQEHKPRGKWRHGQYYIINPP